MSLIGVGAAANDGTGDNIRDAWKKVNQTYLDEPYELVFATDFETSANMTDYFENFNGGTRTHDAANDEMDVTATGGSKGAIITSTYAHELSTEYVVVIDCTVNNANQHSYETKWGTGGESYNIATGINQLKYTSADNTTGGFGNRGIITCLSADTDISVHNFRMYKVNANRLFRSDEDQDANFQATLRGNLLASYDFANETAVPSGIVNQGGTNLQVTGGQLTLDVTTSGHVLCIPYKNAIGGTSADYVHWIDVIVDIEMDGYDNDMRFEGQWSSDSAVFFTRTNGVNRFSLPVFGTQATANLNNLCISYAESATKTIKINEIKIFESNYNPANSQYILLGAESQNVHTSRAISNDASSLAGWPRPWDSATAFVVDDWVTHRDGTFKCISNSTNHEPEVHGSWTTYWQASYALDSYSAGIVIGYQAKDNQPEGVIIGNRAQCWWTNLYPSDLGIFGAAGNWEHVAVGQDAWAGGWRTTALGAKAWAGGQSSTAVGAGTVALSGHGTAFGRGMWAPDEGHFSGVDAVYAGEEIYFENGWAHKFNVPPSEIAAGDKTPSTTTIVLHGQDAYDARFPAWVNSTNYVATTAATADWVQNSNTVYKCIQDNGPSTSVVEPGVTAGWADYWYEVNDTSGATGTPADYNIAGGHIAIAAGRSTGTGTGGQVKLQICNGTDLGQNTKQALVDGLIVDSNYGGAETPLQIRENDGTMLRVELGAADSGGTGYRLLRVVN